MAKSEYTMLEVEGREVRLSNPAKVYFPKPGWTKLDIVEYYLAIAEPALVHLRERPTVMKRFVNGIMEEPIWQKRVPKNIPEWLQTATVAFPSGRTAEELVANDAAHMAWAVNLGVVDFNPWPARRADLDHPDELRVDLDPTEGIGWDDVRRTALVVRDVLDDHSLRGYPKTSGSTGIHVNVRIEPEWDFLEVRRAALALAREVERRAPELATTKWWKEERRGVFVDYNQNARDRTVASCYSVRPTPGRTGLLRAALGGGAGRRTGRAAPRHGARPPRRPGRPAARHRRESTARSTRCSTSPAATKRKGSATRPGRRTSRSRRGSRSGSSPAATATARSTAAAPATPSRVARRRGCTAAASSRASAQSRGPARVTSRSSRTKPSGAGAQRALGV